MPEHGPGTPEKYKVLESFLWWDFDSFADWEKWLKAKALPDLRVPRKKDFVSVLQFQSALRQLEAENNGADGKTDGYEFLNELIQKFGIWPEIVEQGHVKLWPHSLAAPADPICRLLLLVLEAMSAGDWKRFRVCLEPTCRASYYDSSRKGSKTWCRMATCGSRNKMRRLRARQRCVV